MSNLHYTSHPADTPAEDELAQLALDINSTSNRAADELWRQLDAELWERTHNPWAVLQTLSDGHLSRITSEPQFRTALEAISERRFSDRQVRRWFEERHPSSPLTGVVYFSMEYMLSEALPIYSGGLGNVAGDQLKAADDLGVPVTGIGLLYSQGYFRQQFDNAGRRWPSIHSTIPVSCRSGHCVERTATGFGWRFPCPGSTSGSVCGKCGSDGLVSCCSTRTILRTCPNIAASPVNSTAAGKTFG